MLDTGVDETHPDLAEQVAETRSFVPGETVTDVNGHGTHVASTIAGTGAASDGKEKGVAPGADLAIGKVLDDAGSGAESWIIEGMEWAAGRADVVSMSLGSQEASDGTDPMALAVDALSESTGALFVIAAGNYGRVSGIGSPGAAQSALTVGAVDGADERAYFQDMGPRLGDAVVKPEIVAPGVDVLAARSSASDGDGPYVSLSGTSMATPHVAGAAAIIAQQHPDWTGAQIRDALVSTAKPLAGQTAYQVGGGRLDVPSATFGDVVATASVELGYHAWPSDDDAPVDRTITYTNLTDADVTLDLSEAVTADDLSPAPDALVTLSADAGHRARRRHGRRDGDRYAGRRRSGDDVLRHDRRLRRRRAGRPDRGRPGQGAGALRPRDPCARPEGQADRRLRHALPLRRPVRQHPRARPRHRHRGRPSGCSPASTTSPAGCPSTPTAAASPSSATPTSWWAGPTRR